MRMVRSVRAGILMSLMLVSAVFAESGGSRYYAFSRPDLRLCPSPLCGGIFVREVNRSFTRCADDTLKFDCYVASLDTSSLDLSEGRAFAFQNLFGQGRGIVKGSFQPLAGAFAGISVLAAEEAWESEGTAPERGASYLFRDNGIRCFTEPCPSIDETKLNSGINRSIAGIDLGQTGASDSAVAEGNGSLFTTGLIASGRHSSIRGPGGTGLRFVASRFYLKVKDGRLCGGFLGTPCPQDQFCDITVPDACLGADLQGVCKAVPQACIQIFSPVCGCDGVTYGNDCERLAARVRQDHEGACARPAGGK